MQTITTIGFDIAKSIFQVHGVDAVGQVDGVDRSVLDLLAYMCVQARIASGENLESGQAQTPLIDSKIRAYGGL